MMMHKDLQTGRRGFTAIRAAVWGFAILALVFGMVLAGCDNGTSSSDPVEPVEPTPPVDTTGGTAIAPSTPGVVTLTGIAVQPTNAANKANTTRDFTAEMQWSDGKNHDAYTTIQWYVTGGKDSGTTISETGQLTVGAESNGTVLTVRAIGGGKTGTAEVWVGDEIAEFSLDKAGLVIMTDTSNSSQVTLTVTITNTGTADVEGLTVTLYDSYGVPAGSYKGTDYTAKTGSATSTDVPAEYNGGSTTGAPDDTTVATSDGTTTFDLTYDFTSPFGIDPLTAIVEIVGEGTNKFVDSSGDNVKIVRTFTVKVENPLKYYIDASEAADGKGGAVATPVEAAIADTVDVSKLKYINAIKDAIGKRYVAIDMTASLATTIGFQAFQGFQYLTKVTVPDTLATLGAEVFSGCTNLQEVDFGDTAPITAIPSKAFYKSGLTALDPSGNANIVTIGEQAFAECPALAEATLTNITDIGAKAFYHSGVSSDGTALLATLDIDGAVNIGNEAFAKSGLTTLDLSSSSLTNDGSGSIMGERVFAECAGLTSVNIGDLTKIPAGTFYQSGVKPDGTGQLATLTEGASVTEIGKEAFAKSGLASGDLSAWAALTTIGEKAFAGSTLVDVTIPDTVTTLGSEAFAECARLTTLVLFDSSPVLTAIPEKAFYKAIALNNLEIPATITTIGSQAFAECAALTSVTFKYDSSAITPSSGIGNNAFPANGGFSGGNDFRDAYDDTGASDDIVVLKVSAAGSTSQTSVGIWEQQE